MALYNETWMETATSPVDLIVGLGSAMGQPYLMGNLILLSFFVIFMVLAMRHDFTNVLIIDGFITTLLAVIFFYAGMVQAPVIAFPALIMFLGLIFKLFN